MRGYLKRHYKLIITAQDVGSYKPAPAHFERAFAEFDKPGGGATKKPPEDVTPDWQVPTMAAMVELHKAHAGDPRAYRPQSSGSDTSVSFPSASLKWKIPVVGSIQRLSFMPRAKVGTPTVTLASYVPSPANPLFRA